MKINKIKIILGLILLGACSQNIFAMQEVGRKRRREKDQEERRTRANNNTHDYVSLEYMPNEIVANIFMSILRDNKLSVMDRLKKVKSLSGVCHKFRNIFLNLCNVSENNFPKDLPKIYLAAVLDLPEIVFMPEGIDGKIFDMIFDIAIVFRARNLWNMLIQYDIKLSYRKMVLNMQYLTVDFFNNWYLNALKLIGGDRVLDILHDGTKGTVVAGEKYFLIEAFDKGNIEIIEFLIREGLLDWHKAIRQAIPALGSTDKFLYLLKKYQNETNAELKTRNEFVLRDSPLNRCLDSLNFKFIRYIVETFDLDINLVVYQDFYHKYSMLEYLIYENLVKDCYNIDNNGNQYQVENYNNFMKIFEYLLVKGSNFTAFLYEIISQVRNSEIKEELLKRIETELERR